MKLCYRGVEYDYNPPVLETTETNILCQYRGRSLHYSYVRHIPIPQPVAEMKYRGASYRTNSYGQPESVGAPVDSIFAKLSQRALAVNAMADERRALLREASRIHHENMQRSLAHRLAVAQAQGNESLVHQLEDEMHQMV
ncbi:MAG: DUF4278 domain-containing protein [Cyanobacteria bacterium P01_C01_bin.73]